MVLPAQAFRLLIVSLLVVAAALSPAPAAAQQYPTGP